MVKICKCLNLSKEKRGVKFLQCRNIYSVTNFALFRAKVNYI